MIKKINGLIADSYYNLGCLCGVLAKKDYSQKDKDDFLNKSKNYFSQAILRNKYNPQYYRNLSVTNLYLNKKEVKKNLDIALKYAEMDELYSLDINKNTLLDVFEDDDKDYMGTFYDDLKKEFTKYDEDH